MANLPVKENVAVLEEERKKSAVSPPPSLPFLAVFYLRFVSSDLGNEKRLGGRPCQRRVGRAGQGRADKELN